MLQLPAVVSGKLSGFRGRWTTLAATTECSRNNHKGITTCPPKVPFAQVVAALWEPPPRPPPSSPSPGREFSWRSPARECTRGKAHRKSIRKDRFSINHPVRKPPGGPPSPRPTRLLQHLMSHMSLLGPAHSPHRAAHPYEKTHRDGETQPRGGSPAPRKSPEGDHRTGTGRNPAHRTGRRRGPVPRTAASPRTKPARTPPNTGNVPGNQANPCEPARRTSPSLVPKPRHRRRNRRHPRASPARTPARPSTTSAAPPATRPSSASACDRRRDDPYGKHAGEGSAGRPTVGWAP